MQQSDMEDVIHKNSYKDCDENTPVTFMNKADSTLSHINETNFEDRLPASSRSVTVVTVYPDDCVFIDER